MTIEMYPVTYLSQGKYVEAFEKELAKILKVPAWSVIAVSSGTAALHLLAHSFKEQVADYDFTLPATTFIATANALLYEGFKVSPVDVDPETWTAKCQVPVHLYGVTAPTENILFEDACEALGNPQIPVQTHAAFSFFQSKIITTGGEGGAVVCKNEKEAEHIRMLRQQGKTFLHERHQMMGFNYRMTEWQAIGGRAELKQLERRVAACRQINRTYRELLPEWKFQEDPTGTSNCWQTALLVKNLEKLRVVFGLEGIEYRRVFPPLNYFHWVGHGYTPVASFLYEHGMVLPSHWKLTPEMMMKIAKTVREFSEPCQYGD